MADPYTQTSADYPKATERPTQARYDAGHQDAVLEAHAADRARLEHLQGVAKLMDASFTVPGTSIPVGLDTLIGLLPGIGDTISLGVAGYIAAQGPALGASRSEMIRMGGNIAIDWAIGLVPIIGDLFDVGWRGNLRNTAILEAALERRHSEERRAAGIFDG